jgi:pyrroline-5-carboxylate reductase
MQGLSQRFRPLLSQGDISKGGFTMKIAFIGGGNMAEAILSAILVKGLARTEEIIVSDVVESKRASLKGRYQVSVTEDNVEAVNGRDIVVLAVKPQIFAEIAPQLKGRLKADQLVISILAGKNLKTLSGGLAHECIVRSMPNTPAQIGEGMTVWTATPSVKANQLRWAASILGVMGLEIRVDDERYLDMATAVSGSGPAYLFLWVEAMIEAAVSLGFSPEVAQKLVMQTLLGSAHLLQKSGKAPAELRRMVTSPGGTTAEAIASFEKGGFNSLVTQAVTAAYEKARKLGS